MHITNNLWSRGSSVSIETRLRATGWTTRFQLPAGAIIGIFLFATASRQVLGSTKPSYPMGNSDLYLEGKVAGAWS
jgi:hypothetical protein